MEASISGLGCGGVAMEADALLEAEVAAVVGDGGSGRRRLLL